jgi:hypothetical protein
VSHLIIIIILYSRSTSNSSRTWKSWFHNNGLICFLKYYFLWICENGVLEIIYWKCKIVFFSQSSKRISHISSHCCKFIKKVPFLHDSAVASSKPHQVRTTTPNTRKQLELYNILKIEDLTNHSHNAKHIISIWSMYE